jgi:hypothetical protein
VNVRLVGEGVAVGGVTPVPDRLTTCVVGVASSVNVSVALNGFAVAGVNVAAIVQVPPTVTVVIVRQSLPVAGVANAKSPGFVPPKTTVLISKTAVPVLVSVTGCALLVVT